MTDTPTPPQPAVDWRRAVAEERRARELRDQAIVAARRAGKGVRAIAREFGLDPTYVGRVLRREEGGNAVYRRAMAQPCPACGAPPDQRCDYLGGNPHPERVRAGINAAREEER